LLFSAPGRRGIEPFPDELRAELTLGLRRLRTLEMTTCLRLSPLALPILGANCRQLAHLILQQQAAFAHKWPPPPLSMHAAAAAAAVAAAVLWPCVCIQ
jgi:hypothetical protein